MDSPYNERDYRRYYHLPESIALGVVPIPNGKSGVYVTDYQKSSYNQKTRATEAFERLISDADADSIIFHYTDNGLINMNDAKDILRIKGNVEEFYFDVPDYGTVPTVKNCKHHILRMTK